MEEKIPLLPIEIGRQLVLEELFDLTLYKRLRIWASGDAQKTLDELIVVETGHLAFWRNMFSLPDEKLGFWLTAKLNLMLLLARIFGVGGLQLLIEAIEVHGIQNYLALWETHQNDAFGRAIEPILKDEMGHEEVIISAGAPAINPNRIRDLFLGFNDGLVEVLGASSGFFAAFGTTSAVLVAGMSVAVAGSLSMAAGAYAAVGSASEIERTEEKRRHFLGTAGPAPRLENPFASAVVVGVSYFIGALVPLAPVLFGAKNMLISVIVSVLIAIVISYAVAFFSGMNALKRIGINLIALALAVGVTYTIGIFTKSIWGVNL